MAEVKVLIEGYARQTDEGWQASSSAILIEDNDRKILVDPGTNRELILEKLQQEKIGIEDIDIIFLTHNHLDHAFLASMFTKSLILDGTTIYQGDIETEYEEKIPGTNLEVIYTPGHTLEHCSLLVSTDEGKVIIAGDVFWWEDNKQNNGKTESLIKEKDPFAQDNKQLEESRKTLLEMADWIIPGHGKTFKNPSRP